MKPERPPRRPSRLANLLFGTDERTRLRAQLTFWTVVLYACWVGMVSLMNRIGLLSTDSLHFIVNVDLLGPPIFYALIRSGLTVRMRDPGLVLPQMVFASFAIAVTYAVCPTLRASLMQCLCMVQIFGLFSLRPAQTLQAGLAGAGILLAMLVVAPALGVKGFDADAEALRVLTCCFIVVLLAFASRHYAKLRQHVRGEKLELAEAVAQVNELVTHDALTGLHNRQHMQEALEREQARLARGGGSYCVALIDLDHFKHINDTHGHHVGDEVLVAFGQAARAALRASDLAARWGGEEFLILMPDTNPGEHGVAAMARLREQLQGLQVCSAWPDLRVSFSAGVAGCTHDEPLAHLLERVDRALYAAKAAGRQRSVLAEPWPMEPAAQQAAPTAAHPTEPTAASATATRALQGSAVQHA
jgi:diguanylate cyclase (GGDEF)-like protein